MRVNRFKLLTLSVVLVSCLFGTFAFAASLSPALQKAKQEAEAKGFVFLTSHDEIVNMAKKEGKMNAVASLQPETVRALQEGFKAEYPFLDVSVADTVGSESSQRQLMELQAGRYTTDSQLIGTDFYNEYVPFVKKFDVLGMAEQGVLNIRPKFVDPVKRNLIAVSSIVQVVAYNKKLISADKVPDTWEGFLKPEFKGRKFLADIRPREIAALTPVWGLEKTLDFARKLAAQQPIWIRGGTRVLTSMASGEYALFISPTLHSLMRTQAKDPSGDLVYKLVEPVPVRIAECTGILNNAKNPHAALLYWEFLTGPKGQKILNEGEPVAASIFSPYSYVTEVTKGKKISLVDWDHFTKLDGYLEKVLEAYGFPKAEGNK